MVKPLAAKERKKPCKCHVLYRPWQSVATLSFGRTRQVCGGDGGNSVAFQHDVGVRAGLAAGAVDQERVREIDGTGGPAGTTDRGHGSSSVRAPGRRWIVKTVVRSRLLVPRRGARYSSSGTAERK